MRKIIATLWMISLLHIPLSRAQEDPGSFIFQNVVAGVISGVISALFVKGRELPDFISDCGVGLRNCFLGCICGRKDPLEAFVPRNGMDAEMREFTKRVIRSAQRRAKAKHIAIREDQTIHFEFEEGEVVFEKNNLGILSAEELEPHLRNLEALNNLQRIALQWLYPPDGSEPSRKQREVISTFQGNIYDWYTRARVMFEANVDHNQHRMYFFKILGDEMGQSRRVIFQIRLTLPQVVEREVPNISSAGTFVYRSEGRDSDEERLLEPPRSSRAPAEERV